MSFIDEANQHSPQLLHLAMRDGIRSWLVQVRLPFPRSGSPSPAHRLIEQNAYSGRESQDSFETSRRRRSRTYRPRFSTSPPPHGSRIVPGIDSERNR